jgi:hypothetical protein
MDAVAVEYVPQAFAGPHPKRSVAADVDGGAADNLRPGIDFDGGSDCSGVPLPSSDKRMLIFGIETADKVFSKCDKDRLSFDPPLKVIAYTDGIREGSRIVYVQSYAD